MSHSSFLILALLFLVSQPAGAQEPGPTSGPATQRSAVVPAAAWPGLIDRPVEIRTTQGHTVSGKLVTVTPAFVSVETAEGIATVARSTIAELRSESTQAAPVRPPPPPPPPPERPAPKGAGQVCSVHSDCVRPLWCIEGLCRFAAAEAPEEGKRRLSAKGNLQLGGGIAITPVVAIPEHGDNVTGTRVVLSPSLGYFFSDGFELGFELLVSGAFGDLYNNALSTVALAVFARYVFNGKTVQPYVGLGLGPEFFIPDEGDTLTYFDLSLNLGVLVAISDNVALTLAIRPTFAFATGDAQGTMFSMPIGWLGVEAFF